MHPEPPCVIEDATAGVGTSPAVRRELPPESTPAMKAFSMMREVVRVSLPTIISLNLSPRMCPSRRDVDTSSRPYRERIPEEPKRIDMDLIEQK